MNLTRILRSFPETANVFLINGGAGRRGIHQEHAFAGMVFETLERTRNAPQMQRHAARAAELGQIAGFKWWPFRVRACPERVRDCRSSSSSARPNRPWK